MKLRKSAGTIGDVIIYMATLQIIFGVCYHYNFIESKLVACIPIILIVLGLVMINVLFYYTNKYHNRD